MTSRLSPEKQASGGERKLNSNHAGKETRTALGALGTEESAETGQQTKPKEQEDSDHKGALDRLGVEETYGLESSLRRVGHGLAGKAAEPGTQNPQEPK